MYRFVGFSKARSIHLRNAKVVLAAFVTFSTVFTAASLSSASAGELLSGQNIGLVGGAVAGGVLGNKLGGSKHKLLGTAAGGAVGGVVGNMIDKR